MFHYFTIKFHLSLFASFCFFLLLFALHFSLCFDLVIFASKRNKVKRNSSLFFRFCLTFFTFFAFFCFFSLFFTFFSLNFRFASIFSLNFRLFYLPFRFRFLVFRIKVNHVKSGFFFRFQAKRNFCLNFKFRFRSESEGAPYSRPVSRSCYFRQ